MAALCASSEPRAQDLGQDLGVIGPVHPVIEQDMLALIERRARALVESGEWERHMRKARAHARRYLERPPGRALPRAQARRVRTFDPTLVVPYEIRDAQGRLLYPAGTRVNPLDHVRLSSRLLFLDGDDPDQVAWAERMLAEPVRSKPILVAGSPAELIRRWHRLVYFDQHGYLSTRLGIEAVPAIVRQEGKRLTITEVPPQ